MTSSPLAAAPSSSDVPAGRASFRFVVLVLFLAILAQWLVYRNAFHVKPSGDDWTTWGEVLRGDRYGWQVHFLEGGFRYRPLKGLLIWWFTKIDRQDPWPWIRVLHMIAAAGFAGAGALWLRELRVGRAGVVAGMLALTLHPGLAIAVASFDMVDTTACAALLWLGAWFIFHFRGRLAIALAGAIACLFVGIGFREYVFALAPLGALIALLFWPTPVRRARLNAGIIGGALLLAGLIAFQIRRIVVTSGLQQGYSMLRFSPVQITVNFATLTAGLVFLGDPVWVYLHQSPAVLAMVGLACAAFVGLFAAGLWQRARAETAPEDSAPREFSTARWVAFLLPAVAIASLPSTLLFHVSEAYLPPMLLPTALLVALAADGYARRARGILRAAALTLGVLALASSLIVTDRKVDGIADAGERADAQMRQVRALVPSDIVDPKVLLLYKQSDLPPRSTFSVYRLGDDILLMRPIVEELYRPGDGMIIQGQHVDESGNVDTRGFDVVLMWDAKSKSFSRVR